MSAAQLDPHDKMRSRDVSKVARGEQAPRPVHEYGTVSKPPPPASSSASGAQTNSNNVDRSHDGEDEDGDEDAPPSEARSLFSTNARHCYTRYLEYHRCVKEKGENARECQRAAKHCHSACPNEWVQRWDEQRKLGLFPGRI